jgi:hypothetical protein
LSSICGQASYKTFIRISSALKAVFPAYKIDLQMSSAIVFKKGILLSAIAGVLNEISLTFTIFISSSLTSKARFCLMLIAKATKRACKSIKGELRKLLVN